MYVEAFNIRHSFQGRLPCKVLRCPLMNAMTVVITMFGSFKPKIMPDAAAPTLSGPSDASAPPSAPALSGPFEAAAKKMAPVVRDLLVNNADPSRSRELSVCQSHRDGVLVSL